MRIVASLIAALLVAAFAIPAELASAQSANQPPNATINSPTAGGVYPLTATIQFSGTGIDPEDGVLTGGSMFWSSSRNGFLGIGSSFTRPASTLATGSHVIELIATDSRGIQRRVNVTIWIGNPPTPTSTATPTATNTGTPTNTSTPTNTPTPTSTATNTAVPATATRTPTPTRTPSPTATHEPATSTPVPTKTPATVPTATPRPKKGCADVTRDGRVTLHDAFFVGLAVLTRSRDLKWDVDGNGRVNWDDFQMTVRQFGRRCDPPDPPAPKAKPEIPRHKRR